jgi:hypothetical protein
MAELRPGDRVKVIMGVKMNGKYIWNVGSVTDAQPGFTVTQPGFTVAQVHVRFDDGATGCYKEKFVFRLLDWPLEVSKYDVMAALLGNRAPAANADAFETAMLQLLAGQERRERERAARCR